MSQLQIPISVSPIKAPPVLPFMPAAPAPPVNPMAVSESYKNIKYDKYPPRVPCISLNAFAFPVKGTVVEKIFEALGGQNLVKRNGGRYAAGVFNSLAIHFEPVYGRANYVAVSCHDNATCCVEYYQMDSTGCKVEKVMAKFQAIPFAGLSENFTDFTGIDCRQY